ncbi:MAG: ABC-F family ATP-binding cassette domain-containing protein [Bacteroidaceae bacterium]|nr:ABC-F family ATP-binding cassette domain-containing protein [Bacteroidaceae bacterium]
MLSANDISVSFGATPLFRGASFVINARERVALTGKNGAGKSTLLKILAGQQSPTSGSVGAQRGISVGYLPQVMQTTDTRSVIDETLSAFDDVRALQAEVDAMADEMAGRTDYDTPAYADLVERFTAESERLALIGADNFRAETERTLRGLGFRQDELQRPTGELSGGWRMRIELAKLLLRKPDVLLLDEPTNHLDIESIRWLEQYLSRSRAAVMLVSHDRAFLNNVTNRTIEISCGTLTDYRVPYDEYVRLRRERREQQLRAYQNQQKEIADIKDFIERFRYKPTKAVQVQSRIKQLAKIVPIEVDEVDNSALNLKFPPCQRSGDFPVICDGVTKRYGAHTVFSDATLTIRRGEKVAFVGRNGEGKTTLVKCIMGEIPFDGTLKIGHNVAIGYYAQNQAQLLDGEQTVYDTIDRVATGEVRLRLRDILGAFMFGGEASDKKVKVLSGGERSRLAMIKLLLEPVNLLILDEPTNHLDLRTKDVLKEAVRAFDGTVILVSHDRDFLDGLVERVYEFGDGRVREHIGGIYDFLRKKDIETLDQLNALRPDATATTTAPTGDGRNAWPLTSKLNGLISKSNGSTSNSKATGNSSGAFPSPQVADGDGGKAAARLSYAEQKAQARERRKQERAVELAEAEVARLEEELSDLEAALTRPNPAPDLFTRHAEISQALAEAMETWEAAAEALERN